MGRNTRARSYKGSFDKGVKRGVYHTNRASATFDNIFRIEDGLDELKTIKLKVELDELKTIKLISNDGKLHKIEDVPNIYRERYEKIKKLKEEIKELKEKAKLHMEKAEEAFEPLDENLKKKYEELPLIKKIQRNIAHRLLRDYEKLGIDALTAGIAADIKIRTGADDLVALNQALEKRRKKPIIPLP